MNLLAAVHKYFLLSIFCSVDPAWYYLQPAKQILKTNDDFYLIKILKNIYFIKYNSDKSNAPTMDI